MKVCAYCDTKCSPSREHIIPSFLYDFQKNSNGVSGIGWSESAKDIISGEAKIKDVCGSCNNGVLSNLDRYGKQFLIDSGVLVDNFLSKEKLVYYEHDRLLRWLLKISFNSARATKNGASAFLKYRNLILGTQMFRGLSSEIFLMAGLVRPAKLSEEQQRQFSGQLPISACGYSNPFFIRISWVPKSRPNGYVVRVVAIGALVFHLLLFESGMKVGHRNVAAKQWMKKNGGLKLINPSAKAINLIQIDMNFIDLTGMQLSRKQHLEAAKKFCQA